MPFTKDIFHMKVILQMPFRISDRPALLQDIFHMKVILQMTLFFHKRVILQMTYFAFYLIFFQKIGNCHNNCVSVYKFYTMYLIFTLAECRDFI